MSTTASPDSRCGFTCPSQDTGIGISPGFQVPVTETQPRLAQDISIDHFMPGNWYLQVKLDPAAQCPQKASCFLPTIVLKFGKCPVTISWTPDFPHRFPSGTCHRNSWPFSSCSSFLPSCLLCILSWGCVLGQFPGSVCPGTDSLPRCVYSTPLCQPAIG